MGVFCMLRAKLKASGPPLGLLQPAVGQPTPPSRSLHRLQTKALARFPPSFAAMVAVQVPGLQYPVPASAVSKNGCGVTAPTEPAQLPPPMPATPPQYCKTTFLYALANVCPP